MASRLSRRSLAQYVTDGLLAGDKKVIERLAAYLVETRRTKEASLILRDVAYRMATKGTILGTVASAHPLSPQTHKAIEQQVAKLSKADRVQLASEVDPSLLGGYRITLPGRDIDHTVKKQLTLLRTRLKKA